MRNHEPIEIAIPTMRRVVGAVLLLIAGLLLLDVLPFNAFVFGLILLVIASGLLV